MSCKKNEKAREAAGLAGPAAGALQIREGELTRGNR